MTNVMGLRRAFFSGPNSAGRRACMYARRPVYFTTHEVMNAFILFKMPEQACLIRQGAYFFSVYVCDKRLLSVANEIRNGTLQGLGFHRNYQPS